MPSETPAMVPLAFILGPPVLNAHDHPYKVAAVGSWWDQLAQEEVVYERGLQCSALFLLLLWNNDCVEAVLSDDCDQPLTNPYWHSALHLLVLYVCVLA
jgi:hypothetical protein